MSQNDYFIRTIQHLRTYEEVLLFARLLPIGEGEENDTVQYLSKEYSEEALNFPCQPPPFDEKAALWGAKTFYTAAQLLLAREKEESDLPPLLPAYKDKITPAAVLSADLTLRFLPQLFFVMKNIDPDDGLIELLEAHLKTWHYSGIAYALPVQELDFTWLDLSPCLRQLYTDRVIAFKKMPLALHPALSGSVKAALGLYSSLFWKDFQQELISVNEPH